MTLDARELAKVDGVWAYEERMLSMLMLLHMPRTELIYVTSLRVDPATIDYYLHLLPSVPSAHARKRLHLFHCEDRSSIPLTEKILARPRLMQRMSDVLGDRASAHMVCFNATELERSLAVRMQVPLFAADPSLNHFGTKTGSRKMFRAAGIPHARRG